MSEITNPEELDFLKSQWDKQSMPLVKARRSFF